jgi:serine/threonine-protein kinase
MPNRIDKRAAQLLVTRFGADPRLVRETYQEALRAEQRGQPVDLISSFLNASLLTTEQAEQLREALDTTQIDPNAPARRGMDASPVDAANGDNILANPPPVPPAQIVEYRVLRKLGEGGMGDVYLAYDERGERLVAIKLLWPHLAANPSLVERFKRESEHSTRLDHPNIVRGLGSGQDASTQRHYLVMDYVDGPSVQALLDRHGKLAIGDAVHIALDIAHALEHAQSRNIVHRDIKPENILITRTGVAKLADLGLSKATDQVSHLTATRQGFGTPFYMPYEQAVNAKTADGRSDIYALGATLYHLLTGQLPFQGETQVDILEKKEAGVYAPASLINPEIPPALDAILDKMLARDRRDRYQTASELIVDLQRSGLAAPVLSFVDREVALADPVVRARVVLANQVTQPDLQRHVVRNGAADPDTWFLRYHEEDGTHRETKASTEQILRRIKLGQLNGKVQASPTKDGQYRGLGAYGAFRAAILAQQKDIEPALEEPEHLDRADEPLPRWKVWLLACSAVAAGLVVLLILFLALSQ